MNQPVDTVVFVPTTPPRQICVIELGSPLRSKSNYRRSRASSRRSGEWTKHRAFEEELAVEARLARPSAWPLGLADAPLASRPAVVVLIAAKTLLDTANMAKSVTDALEGVLYHNDASIRHVACFSTRVRKDQSAVILVEALDPTASPAHVFASARSLAEQYLIDFEGADEETGSSDADQEESTTN